VIAGKYRVRTILGRGRGVLLLGEHLGFEQRVAIRVVSRALTNEVEVAKFRREAKVLAKLGSEHAARIIDVGELDDGSFYLVRQYLEGIDLVAHLRERRTLPIEEAISIVLQATEAVAEAHAHGILVRELAPEHIFLADRSPGIKGGKRVAKVIDFGTAKLFADPSGAGPQDENTSTAVLGLSPYSSPEMLRRQQDLDVRTDVWSLGAILYELLTGRAPFGSDMMSLALSIVRDDPTPLRRLRPDLPPELESAVLRTLAKNRNDRPADTHAFAASLARFAPAEGRVLMERIHDLASAARQRAGGDVDDAMEISEVEEAEIEDETTNDNPGTMVMGPAAHMKAMATATARAKAGAPRTVTQEKTEALGFSFQPVDPRPEGARAAPRPNSGPIFGGAAASLSSPPPAPAPRTEPPPAMGAFSPMAAAATPPPSSHAARSSLALTSSPSSRASSPALGGPASNAWMQATPAPARPASPNDMGRKVALYAVGGALAALVVLLVVVLVIPPGGGTQASTPTATPSQALAPVAEASGAAATPTPTPTETSGAAVSATAADTSAPAETETAAEAPPPTDTEKPATKKTANAPVATATAKPVETTKVETPKTSAPPPSTNEKGTLVAIAVGGTCSFSVNGASKGTTSSVKLSVNPGNYTVTCKPSSGAMKSKSVEVKSGATAMAMFKL